MQERHFSLLESAPFENYRKGGERKVSLVDKVSLGMPCLLYLNLTCVEQPFTESFLDVKHNVRCWS